MKKQFLAIIYLICTCLCSFKTLADENAAKVLLLESQHASQQLSYELSYIVIRGKNIQPLRFLHAIDDKKIFAHLQTLSGQIHESIQRGNQVSYIEQNMEPFTVNDSKMYGLLPALYMVNISTIASYYDFLSMGRAREAGLSCNVIRISPKDGERYSYVVWIDDQSKLIVRSDLLDRNGDLVEQYRAISVVVSTKIKKALLGLNKLVLPPVINSVNKNKNDIDIIPTWIPNGFKLISSNKHKIFDSTKFAYTSIYGDGLFKFSIYIAKSTDKKFDNNLIRQGSKTLYSTHWQDFAISIVGDIPPVTAKKIAARLIKKESQNKHVKSNSDSH